MKRYNNKQKQIPNVVACLSSITDFVLFLLFYQDMRTCGAVLQDVQLGFVAFRFHRLLKQTYSFDVQSVGLFVVVFIIVFDSIGDLLQPPDDHK
jgi:hypothetical protein